MVSLAILWLVVRHLGSGEDLAEALRQIDSRHLLLPLGLSAVSLALSSVRWRVVLRALDAAVSTRRALYVVLATWPGAAVTPSRASDLLRAVLIRDALPLSEGLGSVITEKLFDAQSLFLLAFVGALWSGMPEAAAAAGIGVIAFWVGLATAPGILRLVSSLGAPRALTDRLERLAVPVMRLRRSPGRIAQLVVLSLAAWVLSIAIIGALLWATGADVGWAHVLCVWPMAVLAGVLPFTLSGIGTRDAAFVFLLQALAQQPVASGPVVAATLLYPLVTTWTFAVIGLPFAVHAAHADPAARRLARDGAAADLDSAGAPPPSARLARDEQLVDEESVE